MKKPQFILCPICGQHKFLAQVDHTICPHCGWEHDFVDESAPYDVHGPNNLPLPEFKNRYLYYIKKNPNYHWAKDGYPEVPQIEPMNCPVCGKHHFNKLPMSLILEGYLPRQEYCPSCGWHYDLEQSDNPNKKDGANKLSLNEYIEEYKRLVKENTNYYFMDTYKFKCPVCGKYEFASRGDHDICPYCGWENDNSDLDDFEINANDLKFSEYKKRYEELIKKDPNYVWMSDQDKK